jgi:hypothetical protein
LAVATTITVVQRIVEVRKQSRVLLAAQATDEVVDPSAEPVQSA